MIVDGIEIRGPTPTDAYKIVYWENQKQLKQIEEKNGQQKWVAGTPYIIGILFWDSYVRNFSLKILPEEWLQHAPSQAACDMILDFIKTKRLEN